MKSFLTSLALLASLVFYSQSVSFSKVEKSVENTDKVFYRINPDSVQSTYLGELEVSGSNIKYNVETFDMVYEKAKEIGANSFSLRGITDIDGSIQDFNPDHFFLSLYYTEAKNLPTYNNHIYIVNPLDKMLTIVINRNTDKLEPYTYQIQKLNFGDIMTISNKKVFGTNIKLSGQENQPVQYYQISGARVKANDNYSGGINFKGGDIFKLERSYAEFLLLYLKEASVAKP